MSKQPLASIDVVPTTKSIIDLSNYRGGSFDGVFTDHAIAEVLDQIILAEHIDESSTGEINRNGIWVKPDHQTKAWRIAKAILVGPNCRTIKEVDIFCYPNDRGIRVSSIEVYKDGKVSTISNTIFLEENRIFGKCANIPKKQEDNEPTVSFPPKRKKSK